VLRTRLATALVALPLLAAALLHPAVFAGVVVAAAATAAYEFFQMALPVHGTARRVGVALAMLVAMGVAAQRSEFWGPALAGAVVVGLLFCLFDAEGMAPAVGRAGFLVLGVVYAGFLLPHFVPLRTLPETGIRWALFVIVVGMASDTGAYFTGRLVGRRPLVPRVSPKKTVEGALGGLGASLAFAVLARQVFFGQLGWIEVAGLGIVISVLGQLGDLTESMFKRAFGAKDSGWIIPGHGGILDRVDSLVFPAVFTYYYAVLVSA
jgi:phosphatidate cytidylyltransferase